MPLDFLSDAQVAAYGRFKGTPSRPDLPIDIYTWLAHRMSYLRKSTLIPSVLLSQQFGSQIQAATSVPG